MNIKSKILIVLLALSSTGYAQNESKPEHHGMKGSHRLTLGLGHTQISEGKIDGKTEWLSIASWSAK